ncbi:MAG: response regulator [Proteobacteria bacterium]|nr:response regulator [Pseudomonadota bacterium]MBU1582890.1 response regulator [Pseudomonadota bacterium]MBU2454660.1 response regulator [Pseudomonadota bacterium]MBU2631713.1 response regulator [Pseudomonadota bacterium]
MDASSAILIVDASDFMRDYMHKSLKNKGYDHILEAVDGKDALDALMEHKVDLILSELNMPKVNGLELLRAISNHSALKHIPFVVLVSDLSDETYKEAMKIGAADYIKKPFTPAEIDNKIKSIMK